MEQICDELGLTMTTAFNIFVKKVIREKIDFLLGIFGISKTKRIIEI